MLRPTPHRSQFTHIRPSLSPSFSERVQSENDSAGCGIIAPKNATITRRPVNILVPPLQRPQVQFLTEPFLTNRDTVAIHFNNIRHAYPLAYLPAPNLRSTKKFSLLIISFGSSTRPWKSTLRTTRSPSRWDSMNRRELRLDLICSPPRNFNSSGPFSPTVAQPRAALSVPFA